MLTVGHQLRQIIHQCDGHQNNPESIYLQKGSVELKQIHHDIDLSIHNLSCIDKNSSQNQQQEIRNNEFDDSTYTKPFPQLSERRFDHKSKSKLRESLESKRGAFSVLSIHQPRHKTQAYKNDIKQQGKSNLCSLISRVNKNKLPINASRNMLLSWNRKESVRKQADNTYEFIRDQRRKADEMRHIIVMGKIMGENYRKGLKKLQARRRIFMRGCEITKN